MAGFSDQLAKFAERTKIKADVVVRKVTIDVAGALILRSPVDTGRFRGAWVYGQGAPNTTTPDTPDKDGSIAQARISQAVGTMTAGGVAYITNSSAYARRLEYGWSKQAPQGFVRITALEYQQFLRKALAS
jgi:hypothetical protein